MDSRDASKKLQKIFYRRPEAAFALGLSVREIDRLIAARRLTPRRYKRCVLISAAEVKNVAAAILRDEFA